MWNGHRRKKERKVGSKSIRTTLGNCGLNRNTEEAEWGRYRGKFCFSESGKEQHWSCRTGCSLCVHLIQSYNALAVWNTSSCMLQVEILGVFKDQTCRGGRAHWKWCQLLPARLLLSMWVISQSSFETNFLTSLRLLGDLAPTMFLVTRHVKHTGHAELDMKLY